jgi:hypothetical protein
MNPFPGNPAQFILSDTDEETDDDDVLEVPEINLEETDSDDDSYDEEDEDDDDEPVSISDIFPPIKAVSPFSLPTSTLPAPTVQLGGLRMTTLAPPAPTKLTLNIQPTAVPSPFPVTPTAVPSPFALPTTTALPSPFALPTPTAVPSPFTLPTTTALPSPTGVPRPTTLTTGVPLPTPTNVPQVSAATMLPKTGGVPLTLLPTGQVAQPTGLTLAPMPKPNIPSVGGLDVVKPTTPALAPSMDAVSLLEKLPGITITALTPAALQTSPDINNLMQKEADESDDEFEARRRLTLRLTEIMIGGNKINNAAAVVIGFIMMKKSKLGVEYDPEIEATLRSIVKALDPESKV